MKRGFTLLELIIVIIIIGVLATLGFTQYTKMVEKSRLAEARLILGQLRNAEQMYYTEKNTYTLLLSDLAVVAPTSGSDNYYFYYDVNLTHGKAIRCTSAPCKVISTVGAYNVTLEYATGTFNGTLAGYY